MAGTGDGTRIITNFRDQWPTLPGHYVTYSLSFDHFIPKYKSGIGLLILRDNEGRGKLTTTQVGLNYSYRINLSRDFHIQPGLQFQYYQRSLGLGGVTYADQYVGNDILSSSIETPPDARPGHIDFSSSLLAFGKNFWIGFTVDHLMKLNTSLEYNEGYVALKTSVYGGQKFIIHETLLSRLEQSITCAFNYRRQAGMQQLDIGLYYHQMPFMVGIWYRGLPVLKNIKSQDALTISGGIELHQFTFTYSYDLTISSLVTSTGGAHELGMLYTFDWGNNYNRRRKMATVPCPKF
jgi:type IX secretion system PorP/SprF family membrane protein